MLQSEAQILRSKLGEQETAELSNLVSKEIAGMSNEELKSKIVKLAQAYRTERLRNEELQKALERIDIFRNMTINENEDLGDVTNMLNPLNVDIEDMTVDDDNQYVPVEEQSLKERITQKNKSRYYYSFSIHFKWGFECKT